MSFTIKKGLGILAVLFVVGVVLVAGLIFVVARVPEERPGEAAALAAQARERFERDQALPADQNSATLLQPLLVGKDEAEPGPLVGPVTWDVLTLLSDYASGVDGAGIRERLGKDAAKADADVAAYAPVVAMMREAVLRPKFVWWGRWEDGWLRDEPNYIRMRALSQGLMVSGVHAAMKGRVREALDDYLVAMAWGAQSSGQGPLINEMIALAVASIPMDPLLELLDGGRLAKPDLQQAVTALNRLPFSKETFRAALDGEFGTGMETFRVLQSGKAVKDLDVPWFYQGFLLTRDQQIYSNIYLELREEAIDLDGEPPRAEGPFPRDATFWQTGLLPRIMVPNLTRGALQYRLFLTNLGGARILAALRLHHAEHGRWPARLVDLGMELPRNYMRKSGEFDYAVEGDTMTLAADGVLFETMGYQHPRRFHPYAPLRTTEE